VVFFLFQQPSRCAGLSAHRIEIPPQVPLTPDGGAFGGIAVGLAGAWLPRIGESQQREDEPTSRRPAASAAGVTPSAATGATDEAGRAITALSEQEYAVCRLASAFMEPTDIELVNVLQSLSEGLGESANDQLAVALRRISG